VDRRAEHHPSLGPAWTTFPGRAVQRELDDVRRAKALELESGSRIRPCWKRDDTGLARTYRASLTDLAALSLQPDLGDPATLPAAGLPWFMALFGRDSLITSFQALPYLPGSRRRRCAYSPRARRTRAMTSTSMEPGKILHELRFGELTATGRQPHSPYFGSADATPLFLILLDEYHRWTGDDDFVRTLEPNARAALAWTEDGGDLDGDGYVEYFRRNPINGLVNQCWKDSGESIQFADGTLASGPIATCEIQGYVFDARRRGARLAREVWGDHASPIDSTRLPERCRSSSTRTTGCPSAVPTRSHSTATSARSTASPRTSVSCSGRASSVCTRPPRPPSACSTAALLGLGRPHPRAREAGYNPLGYHTGTVWPHDNSLIVAGLARYGHDERRPACHPRSSPQPRISSIGCPRSSRAIRPS
jgi:glycogen debranching enzyme